MGKISVSLRPVLVGFIVTSGDRKGLIEAIETASALWGGVLAPIIPLVRRITGQLRKEIPLRVSASQMIAGYLDTFDPDVLLKVNNAAMPASLVGNRAVKPSTEVLKQFSYDGTPSFGIGPAEVLSFFARTELTYVRKDPLRIVFPNFAKGYRAFLGSVFGRLRPDIEEAAQKAFPSGTKIETPDCSIDNFAKFLTHDTLFLRRLMSQHLQIRPSEACLFFLNAGSMRDIIDYWNLRAAGWSVLPVPQQACKSISLRERAAEFVNENYWAYRNNPEIFHDTKVIKGRDASARDLVEFINSLPIDSPTTIRKPKIVIVPTYPRLWDEWAREKDAVDVQRVYSSKTDIELSDDIARVRFSPIAPKFISRFGGHGSPRFANDVEVRFYGRSGPYAEVIPSGDKRLVRAIGAYGFENWRFSRHGLSHLCAHPEFPAALSPPYAERVFSEWLRCDGWKVELSDKGYIATQMLKRLGGISGIGVLASRGLVALLKSMTVARSGPDTTVLGIDPTASTEPSGKILKAKTFIGEIAKLCAKEGSQDPDQYLRRLLDLQMFRAGLEVQCPTCRQRWWQSLKELDYQLSCPNCFETFSVTSWLPKDFEWAFRTVGPFSLPDSAFGIYAVLLTLHFFSILLRGASTPLLSFKLSNAASEVEVDLGLLFEQFQYGKAQRDTVFVECKTYNEFTRQDILRLESIGDEFPGSVLVVATLKDRLSLREQTLLRPFVNRCRRYDKAERPVHPVLILTGNELFAEDAPPRCWEALGEKYSIFKDRYELAHNLADLADATQRIYLDLPPWHQWMNSKRPPPPVSEARDNAAQVDESLIFKMPVLFALRQVEFGDWQ